MPSSTFYLRDIMYMTVDEAASWGLILARATGHLNGRLLLGIRPLKRGKRNCDGAQDPDRPWAFCGKAAVMALLYEYRGKYYQVYLCRDCYRRTVEAMERYIKRRIDQTRESLLKFIEEG